MDNAADELKSQALLEGLDAAALEKISRMFSLVKVPKNEYVFREKEPCQGIWMIKGGRLEISKTTADGWKQPLVILGAGSFVGEIATLEGTVHATDARALENAELLLFPISAFEELEQTEPKVMLRIIKNIAMVSALNVRRMNDKFLKVLVNY